MYPILSKIPRKNLFSDYKGCILFYCLRIALTKSPQRTFVVPYQILRTCASLRRFGKPVL